MSGLLQGSAGCAVWALLLLELGCAGPVELGSDLLWTSEHESGDLEEWLGASGGDVRLPSADSSVAASAEQAHRGKFSARLVNPAQWDGREDGPELFHPAGALTNAYYSAWFMLPESYALTPLLVLMRLRSRDPVGGETFGEELQLRSVASGGYVLMVFNHDAEFLREPIAEPAPLVAAGRWFQLEAQYEPGSARRLRVWLDGTLAYDLEGRPGAAGAEVTMSVCNVAEGSSPAPLTVFVDDAAVSLTRVSPTGRFSYQD